MTEKEKMLSGQLYNASDPELRELSRQARGLYHRFNSTSEDEIEYRIQLLDELLGSAGQGLIIQPPFFCDYGFNISVGDNVFMNMNCCILDIMQVTIGSRTMFGPNVQIYTATHPMDPVERASGLEFAKPISIGENVWIGGGAIINPGVTVGNGVVIGAGAIVTKDVPEMVFIGGNPARVIREI